jgi:hypothetical protein
MLYFVYWERHYVGTVEAISDEEALVRAAEKFGPFLGGTVEVKAQVPRPSSTCTRSAGHREAAS